MARYLTPVGTTPVFQVPFSGGSTNSRSFGGPRSRGSHAGVDIPAPIGSPIYAIDNGTVVGRWKSSSGYGNIVDVEYPDGTVHRFAHLSDGSPLAVGTKVQPGTVIGYAGVSGNANANFQHVHHEIVNRDHYYAGSPVTEKGSNAIIGRKFYGRSTEGRQDPRLYYMGFRGPGAVVEFQQAAKQAGLYDGAIDGIDGPLTQKAIAAGGQLARDGGTTAVAAVSHQPWDVIDIKTDLKERGFWDGPIDGNWSEEVQTQLTAYAASEAGKTEMASLGVEAPATAGPTNADVALIAGMAVAEAGGEGREGMQRVINVMQNRVADTTGRFPDTLGDVLRQQPEEWAKPIDINNPPPQLAASVADAVQLAQEAVNGTLPDLTNNATYFRKTTIAPLAGEVSKGVFGAHLFQGDAVRDDVQTAALGGIGDVADLRSTPAAQPVAQPAAAPAPPVEDVSVPGTVQPAVATRGIPAQPAPQAPATSPESLINPGLGTRETGLSMRQTQRPISAAEPIMPGGDPWARAFNPAALDVTATTGQPAGASATGRIPLRADVDIPIPGSRQSAVERWIENRIAGTRPTAPTPPVPPPETAMPDTNADVYRSVYGQDRRAFDAAQAAEERATVQPASTGPRIVGPEPPPYAQPEKPPIVSPEIRAPQPVEEQTQPAAAQTPLSNPNEITVGGEGDQLGHWQIAPASLTQELEGLPDEPHPTDDPLGQGGFQYFNPWTFSPKSASMVTPPNVATGPLTAAPNTTVSAAGPTINVSPGGAGASGGGGPFSGRGLFGRLFGPTPFTPKGTSGTYYGDDGNWDYQHGTTFGGNPATQFTGDGRTYNYVDQSAWGQPSFGGWSR